MLQQVMTAPGEIVFQEVPIPKPKSNEVVVRIHRIGVCGSDIHVFHGKHPFTKYPITQGHEVSGSIVKTGDGVTQWKTGQHVTIEPQLVCGTCHPCLHGKYNLCESLKVMGFQAPGMAAEYFCVDESKLSLLPDSIGFDEGAMIEPLAVAVHAVKQAGDISGKKVAVLGAGPIGNLVAQAALGMGAEEVLITDVSDYRLALASKTGISHCINTGIKDFGEALTYSFGSDKADVIYDCAGNNITMGQAIKHARKGSTIILVAVFDGPADIDLAVLNDHELRLDSSMMYKHEDYIDAISLVEQNKVQLQPLVSKHFSFNNYLEAYKYIDKHRETTMKVMISVYE